MANWRTSLMQANNGYRSADHGNFVYHINTVSTEREANIRRQKVRITSGGGIDVVGGFEYMEVLHEMAGGLLVTTRRWRTGAVREAKYDTGSFGNNNKTITWDSEEDPWISSSDGNTTYRMWVKSPSHTTWGNYVTIHGFFGTSQINVGNLRPTISQVTTEGNTVTSGQELAVDQPIRIAWNSPNLPSPHTGEMNYQRIKVIRNYDGNRSFWNGSTIGNIWGPDSGFKYNGNPPRGYVDFAANRWGGASGTYKFSVILEQDWDFEDTRESATFTIEGTNVGQSPSQLPLLDNVRPTITHPANNSLSVDVGSPLRLRWSFTDNTDLNDIAFSKIIVRRFQRIPGGGSFDRQRLTRANPPRWEGETGGSSSTGQSISPDGQYLDIGAGWAEDDTDYYFEIRLFSLTHNQAGLTSWTQLSNDVAFHTTDSSPPTPPTIAFPSSSSTFLHNPDNSIDFRILMPPNETAERFRLKRRRLNSNSEEIWIEYETGFGLTARWFDANDISIVNTSASLASNADGGELRTIELPARDWQPENSTYFYSASYYQEGYGWTDYGSQNRVRTDFGATGTPTIVSPSDESRLSVHSSLNIDYRDAIGTSSDEVQISRAYFDGGTQITEFWTGSFWTTTPPTSSNDYGISRSYVSGTGNNAIYRARLSSGWQQSTAFGAWYSIAVKDNNIWSEWTDPNNLWIVAITPAPT